MTNKGNIKIANIKKKEPFDLYIGRENKWLNLPESKWKNPFPLKRESERAQILEMHWEYMISREDLINDLIELKGKTLGCYCYSDTTKIGKTCHGHNLIRLYDKFVSDEKTTII